MGANINKRFPSEVEKEQQEYVELFKHKSTGELMYLDKSGTPVIFPTQPAVQALITSSIPAPEYTETIVNISSAQLSSVTLEFDLIDFTNVLGNYPDIDRIEIQYTDNGLQYNGTSGNIFFFLGGVQLDSNTGTLPTDWNAFPSNYNIIFKPTNISTSKSTLESDCKLQFVKEFSWGGGGNGTLRVKIYHKTVTFGA